MSTIYTYDIEQLNQFANDVKDAIAEQLDISELNKVVVVVWKPGMFGKLYRKIIGMDENIKGLYIEVLSRPRVLIELEPRAKQKKGK